MRRESLHKAALQMACVGSLRQSTNTAPSQPCIESSKHQKAWPVSQEAIVQPRRPQAKTTADRDVGRDVDKRQSAACRRERILSRQGTNYYAAGTYWQAIATIAKFMRASMAILHHGCSDHPHPHASFNFGHMRCVPLANACQEATTQFSRHQVYHQHLGPRLAPVSCKTFTF